jgi:endonuclease YncB( thermonuclease family)
MKRSVVELLIILLGAPEVDQATLMGAVTHVRGGDTIEIADIPIRLDGIAAPELNEPQGPAARDFMQHLVAGKTVRCELSGERSFDRVIGVCFLDGKDIGALVINAGLARDCPGFSGGKYEAMNTAASERLPLPGYCVQR